MEGFMAGPMLTLSYILVIIAIIGAVGLPIYKSLDNPKAFVRTGIALGAVLAVYLISLMFSGSEVTAKYASFGVDEGLSKNIGAVLIMCYIMLFAIIAGIIYDIVARFLDR
jgi:hydrogenase/urease accessory protein HupE